MKPGVEECGSVGPPALNGCIDGACVEFGIKKRFVELRALAPKLRPTPYPLASGDGVSAGARARQQAKRN
ncbi:MAG TPA: hypothetical protein VIH22_00770 [Cyclobacteriaceae bacterium]